MPSSSTPSSSMSIEATLFELLWGYTTPVHVHLVSHLLQRGERYTTATPPPPPHHGGSLPPSSLSLPAPDRDEGVGVLPLNQMMMMMRRGEFHSDLDDDVSSSRLHREGEGLKHEIVRSTQRHARQILFQAVASRCLVLDRTLRGICSSRAPSEERGTKLPMQPMVFLALRLELSTKSCHRSAEYGASRSTFRSQAFTAAAKRNSVVVRPRVVWAELMMEQEEQAEVRMLPQRRKEQNADEQQQQPEVLAVCSKELWDAWGECTRHDWCWYMYQVAYSIACHERWLVALQQEEKKEEEESKPHHDHHHHPPAARGPRPNWTSRPQCNPFSSSTTTNSSKGIIAGSLTGSEPVTAYLLRRTVRDVADGDDDERSKQPPESRRMPTHESKQKGLQAAAPASGTTTHTAAAAAAAASRNNHHRAGGRGAMGNVPPPKKRISANVVVVVDVDAATTTLRNQSATSSITTNHATGRNHTAQNRGRILESRQRATRVKRTRSPFEEEGDDEEKDSSEVVVLSD